MLQAQRSNGAGGRKVTERQTCMIHALIAYVVSRDPPWFSSCPIISITRSHLISPDFPLLSFCCGSFLLAISTTFSVPIVFFVFWLWEKEGIFAYNSNIRLNNKWINKICGLAIQYTILITSFVFKFDLSYIDDIYVKLLNEGFFKSMQ